MILRLSSGVIGGCIMFFRRKTAFVLLESRVRENCLHGSEGGAVNARPYPYQEPAFGVRKLVCALRAAARCRVTESSKPPLQQTLLVY